jgi:glycosyltransferase involved in cell wall biosynthesis
MVRGAARVHYTTSAEREQAERALGLDDGAVIPLGVEDDLLERQGDGGRLRAACPALGSSPYVVFLSRIDPKKRLEPLMDAFAEATRSPTLASWRLVVAGAGDPEYLEGVRRHAARLPGAERIVFAGWLEGAIRESALRGAELLALPSHQENFGLSAIEALACGVPVLVSDGVDIAGEIRRAQAGWVVTLDDGDLTAVLEEAMASDDERRTRGRVGRELVRSRYRWAAVAPRLVELYRGVAKSRTRKVP